MGEGFSACNYFPLVACKSGIDFCLDESAQTSRCVSGTHFKVDFLRYSEMPLVLLLGSLEDYLLLFLVDFQNYRVYNYGARQGNGSVHQGNCFRF